MDAGNDLARYLLGSGALTVILIALVQAALKLYENRTSLKNANVAVSREEEIEDSRWNAAYRGAGERHIFWDVTKIQELLELRAEVNRLRGTLNLPPREFPPLESPPPLFPPPPS